MREFYPLVLMPTMKEFYALVLMLGGCMVLVVPVVTFATPPDANIASALSNQPDEWSLTLSEELKEELRYDDVKRQVVTALANRASFLREFRSRSLWGGLVLMVLAAIGLVREWKLERLRRLVE